MFSTTNINPDLVGEVRLILAPVDAEVGHDPARHDPLGVDEEAHLVRERLGQLARDRPALPQVAAPAGTDGRNAVADGGVM